MNSSTNTLTVSEDIVIELRNLGISAGDLACLHGSLLALGFVLGGSSAVIEVVGWRKKENR